MNPLFQGRPSSEIYEPPVRPAYEVKRNLLFFFLKKKIKQQTFVLTYS